MKFTGVSLDYLFPFILGFFDNKILNKALFDQLKTWHNTLLKYYSQNDKNNFFSLIVNIWCNAKKFNTIGEDIDAAVRKAFDNIKDANSEKAPIILNIKNTLGAIQKLINAPIENLTNKMSILAGYIKEHPDMLDNFNNQDVQQGLSDDNKEQSEVDPILTNKLGMPKEVEQSSNIVKLSDDFKLSTDILSIYELYFTLGFDNMGRDGIVKTMKTFFDMLSNKFIQSRLDTGSNNQFIIDLLKKHKNMLESPNNFDDYIKYIGGDEQGLLLKDIFGSTPDINQYENFLKIYYIDDVLKDKEILIEDRYNNIGVNKPQSKYNEILTISGVSYDTLSDLVNKDTDDLSEQLTNVDPNSIQPLFELFKFAMAIVKFNYNFTKEDSIGEVVKKLKSILVQLSVNNNVSFKQIIDKILSIIIVYGKDDEAVKAYIGLLHKCDDEIENIHKSNQHLFKDEIRIFKWLCIDNDKEFNSLEDMVSKLNRFKIDHQKTIGEQHGLMTEIANTLVAAFSKVDLSNNNDDLAKAINVLYFDPVTVEQAASKNSEYNGGF